MPDIWFDVDTALAEVPVNVLPLVDDTDFKSREVSIAYNAAGMDLVWNFVTTGGAYTQTAVTPTTGGVYDWAHQGDGMYSIEMPASGGASANNDTEGFGWFSGVATGVLPWRGPVVGFRAAALNNSLVDGATIDVNTTAVSGTAQTARDLGLALPAAAPAASGGLPTTNGTKLNQTADLTAGQTIAATVAGDVGGKVLGGGSGTITDVGVRADLRQILGAAITGTAAQIVAAFTKFFNVASPTGTVNSLPDAVAGATGGVAIVGSKMDVVDAPNATGVAVFVTAIWAAATSGMSTVGSIGKKLADWVVGKVLTYDTAKSPAEQVLATPAQPIATNASGYVTYANAAPPTAASIVTATWTALLASPDFGTAASIGKLLKDNIDAAISTRGTGTALDAAGIRTAIGMLSANLDTQLAALPTDLDVQAASAAALTAYDPPTNTEMEARTIPSASYALEATLTARLPMAVKRNTALAAFPFQMMDSSDHVSPKSGLTVTAKRKLDSGAWATCANAVTVDSGAPSPTYLIDLAAADLNGAVVTLAFTATGADPLQITILTQA